MSVNQVYDAAWKVLTDPDTVWGRHIIGLVVGETIGPEWTITSADTESHDDDGKSLRADRVVVMTKDKISRTIHIEFQSTFDSTMAKRMLLYGIQHGAYVPGSPSVPVERLRLPVSYILDVVPGRNNDGGTGWRTLELEYGSQTISFAFPVKKGYRLGSALDVAQAANDVDELDRALFSFAYECGSDITELRFYNAVRSLCVSDILLKSGKEVTVKEVNRLVKDLFNDGKSVHTPEEWKALGERIGKEEGRAAGREEAIAEIRRRLLASGMTPKEVDAILLGRDTNPAEVSELRLDD